MKIHHRVLRSRPFLRMQRFLGAARGLRAQRHPPTPAQKVNELSDQIAGHQEHKCHTHQSSIRDGPYANSRRLFTGRGGRPSRIEPPFAGTANPQAWDAPRRRRGLEPRRVHSDPWARRFARIAFRDAHFAATWRECLLSRTDQSSGRRKVAAGRTLTRSPTA